METKVISRHYNFTTKDGKHLEGDNYYLVVETPLGSVNLKIDAKGFEKQILKSVVDGENKK